MHCSTRMLRATAGIIVLWIGIFWVSAFSAGGLNYDTAWTFSYDGGLTLDGDIIDDYFRDVKILPNGDVLCVGETRDSTLLQNIFLIKLSSTGKLLKKKLLAFNYGAGGGSVLVANNGDYVVGGRLSLAPFLLRLDTSLNIKTQAWYYDSLRDSRKLRKDAILQSLAETSDGSIIATGGDLFPNNESQQLNNYAVWMKFDPQGAVKGVTEWIDETGYLLSGWSLAATNSMDYLVGGQQSVARYSQVGVIVGKNRYTFSLPGIGTVANNITRVRRLRDGRLLAIGQAYEEDCWTRYKRYSYDGWWSILSPIGQALGWNVAGVSGKEDILYDATQLADGRIAFVGIKGAIPDSGVWVFVTDAEGKTLEWERRFNLPSLLPDIIRDNLSPNTLVATPDSGFLLVGYEGATGRNDNAFAIKFVPKPVPTSAAPYSGGHNPSPRWEGGRVVVVPVKPGDNLVLKLFNVQGAEVARYSQTGNQKGQCRFDIGELPLKRGMYLWEIMAGQVVSRGSFAALE